MTAGDVTAIINSSGALAVLYTYDAWGNVVSTTGSMASTLGTLNPIRYRSYVYDQETGLYYLESRYYDPRVGRFINADALVSTGQGTLGNNMFAYCGNNPVMRYDPSGAAWTDFLPSWDEIIPAVETVWEKIKEFIRMVLHEGNNTLVEAGMDTAAVCAPLLCMFESGDGVYHADPDCWQQYMGYCSMYDFLFDAGTSMDTKQFKFTHRDCQYIIWAWTGDYINLGAGGELGIYYGGGPLWYVDDDLSMWMSMDLYHNGNRIISYNAYTWWITGFNSNYQNVNASELTATYTLYFEDSAMFQSFYNTHFGSPGWTFDTVACTATYTLGGKEK